MSKKIRLYNIEWDLDNDDELPPTNLPTEVIVEVNNHWDPAEDAAELLSDTYDFLVIGCNWEEA